MTDGEDAVRRLIGELASGAVRKATMDRALDAMGREMMRGLMPRDRRGRVMAYYHMVRSMVNSGLSDACVESKLFEVAFDHGEAAEALAQWRRDMEAGK